MLTTAPVQRQVARVGKPGRHAIVIGSGLGGLAAAIRLGARGYRVTVLERLDGPGGRAYVFRQDGFTFDAGPTIITAPFLLEELWSLVGRTLSQDIDLRPLDPFYRIRFHDGETLDCYADEEEMRAEVARLSPGDVDGFEAFMEKSAEIYRVGFEELGAVPFANFSDMVKVLPDFVRLAESFGHSGIEIRDRDELEPRMAEAFAQKDRLVFLDIYIDPMEHVYPMHVAPNGSMKDMWLSKTERS